MKWDEPRGGRGADIAEIGKAKTVNHRGHGGNRVIWISDHHGDTETRRKTKKLGMANRSSLRQIGMNGIGWDDHRGMRTDGVGMARDEMG